MICDLCCRVGAHNSHLPLGFIFRCCAKPSSSRGYVEFLDPEHTIFEVFTSCLTWYGFLLGIHNGRTYLRDPTPIALELGGYENDNDENAAKNSNSVTASEAHTPHTAATTTATTTSRLKNFFHWGHGTTDASSTGEEKERRGTYAQVLADRLLHAIRGPQNQSTHTPTHTRTHTHAHTHTHKQVFRAVHTISLLHCRKEANDGPTKWRERERR